MQQLISLRIDEHGTVEEVFDEVCTMTGYRTRYVQYTLKSGRVMKAEIGPS